MRIPAVGLIVLVTVSCAFAQTVSAPQSGNSNKITAAAVWNVPQDFLTKAHAACDAAHPPDYGQCFIDQMATQGAPGKAVSFSLMLYKQSDGQVGIMVGFEPAGAVDMARVMYPLRANDNYGLLFVNGDPNILDVDNLKKLDQAGMEKAGVYQVIKERFPKVAIFSGDRSGTTWPQMQPIPNVGEQFIIGYPLLDGCHACRPLGLARFAWQFDAQGKFLNTVYIPTPPPPRLMRPLPPTGAAPAQPTQPPAQQQPAQPPQRQ
jgi:hypothetical protein